ncbi:hypothetical protein [Duganella vulcania]|uniref:Uncharacterized protein n=1 Tax=Duganella vulcania TaxID=2692166 RepID=A0A845GIP2_9BURK|nr:hypothetical protein [Duganella vulcania]MYM92627.1 hypothetical protein [Duganella vulcania]
MKPKYIFWAGAIAFALLALRCALNGQQYMALFTAACAIAGAANALRPDADRRATRADLKKLLGVD